MNKKPKVLLIGLDPKVVDTLRYPLVSMSQRCEPRSTQICTDCAISATTRPGC